MRHYAQSDRDYLFRDSDRFRKTSTLLAFQSDEDFTIETDRGVMTGVAGDWIARNHPDDDPDSDIWSISDARMKSTYERA